MTPFRLVTEPQKALRVLCLGAHSDDIEIGCGGTLLALKQWYPAIRFDWAVFSAAGVRKEEAARAAELFTAGACLESIQLHEFADGFLPYTGGEVKAVFEDMKRRVSPDLIFTHYGKDAHQDHRLLAELTWNTYRNHTILEYEIPKYDGDLGSPNVFVPLTEEICQQKVAGVIDVFRSQHAKHWFDEETFRSLMRIRGMEAAARGGYAEAFYCRKLILQ